MLELAQHLPQTLVEAEALGVWMGYVLLAALFFRW
jgi:hypothetical protein